MYCVYLLGITYTQYIFWIYVHVYSYIIYKKEKAYMCLYLYIHLNIDCIHAWKQKLILDAINRLIGLIYIRR